MLGNIIEQLWEIPLNRRRATVLSEARQNYITSWKDSKIEFQKELHINTLELTITFKDKFLEDNRFYVGDSRSVKKLWKINYQVGTFIRNKGLRAHLILDMGKYGRPHYHGILNLRDNKEAFRWEKLLTKRFGRTRIKLLRDTNKYAEYVYKIYDPEQPKFREDYRFMKEKCEINTM